MAFRINNNGGKVIESNNNKDENFTLHPVGNIVYKYKYNPTNKYLTQLISSLNKYEYSTTQIGFDSVNNEWVIQ
jgi:hypothetical protein